MTWKVRAFSIGKQYRRIMDFIWEALTTIVALLFAFCAQ